jgi:hypothetical protein
MNTSGQTSAVGQYAILAGTALGAMWLLVSVSLGYSVATTASAALSAMLFVQWFVAILSAPVFVQNPSLGKVIGSALGIVLIPWPLLALCIQMTNVSIGSLLAAQLLLLGTMLALFGAATWLRSSLPPAWQTSAVSFMQTVPAIGLVLSWPHWSGWVFA